MINYDKLLKKIEEKGITTYVIRKKGIIPQSTLAKFRMCSSSVNLLDSNYDLESAFDEILQKLENYKKSHSGKDFMIDVSTKTIEDICQLLQCQPQDIMDWKVELKPELSYESRFLDKSDN